MGTPISKLLNMRPVGHIQPVEAPYTAHMMTEVSGATSAEAVRRQNARNSMGEEADQEGRKGEMLKEPSCHMTCTTPLNGALHTFSVL